MKYTGQWLVLVCALLTLSAAASAQDARPDPSSGLPLAGLKLEELTATRERPLFAPDRRRQPPPRAAPPASAAPREPPSPQPEFALRGIISYGSSTFVLLEDKESSESIVVRSGERIGAWKITADTDHSVTLAREGEQIRLQIVEDESEDSPRSE